MRFAYADPPYIGQAVRHYRTGGTAKRKVAGDPDAQEVNHRLLVGTLVSDYPDGWALSCSTPSLRIILPLCPDDVRVAAWVKPFAAFKVNVNPAYAWESVIFRGGRKRTREDETVRDWHSEVITLSRGTVGAKPIGFCLWVLRLLGFAEGDTLDDLFPGSGAVSRAVALYRSQTRIPGVA